MLRWLASFAAMLLFATVGVAQNAKDSPSKAKLGEKITGLTFQDEKGNKVPLADLQGKKATVVVFLSFECPVSNSYAQPLVEMAKGFGKHGVAFVGIAPNQDETPASIAKYRKEYDVAFPIYRDEQLKAANAFAADVTPEAFVLDGEGVLRYRGRIDSTWVQRLKKHNEPVRHDLKQVIGEMLSGKTVSVPATAAIGCPIDRAGKATATEGKVTYYRDVLPILQERCQTCHRPGEVGPFSLMTYKQAVNWASDIKEYTQNRQMPPFKVSESLPLHNDRKMTDKEIATLAAWVDGGTPKGDPKQAPPEKKFVEGWQLGQPDIVLTPSDEFLLGPNGRDVFRCFVMPTNLPEDVYVRAIEVRPANPRVVHHSLLFIDTTGQGRKLEKTAQDSAKKGTEKKDGEHAKTDGKFDIGPGYSVAMGVGFIPQGGLLGWAPGQMPRYLPENSGILLPKNSDVVMQIHYHRNGRPEKDRTQVGLYISKKPSEKTYAAGVLTGRTDSGILGGRFFVIPAGEEKFELKGDSIANKDFTLYSVMPHMHMLGKSIKVTMTPPEGAEQTLVSIPHWDYNWQETYFFKEPISVKAGTKLHVEALYDNSSKNPMNPNNPPRMVTFGEQTFNEMCFVFLGGSSPNAVTGGLRGRSLPLSSVTKQK